MLQNLQKRKESGFTIIEVLIVLAIAGLIMLVVFLAVPALQRNSRNTQYRNEASRLLASYSEVSSNNGGAVLNGAANATSVLDAANTKNITSLDINVQGATNPGTVLNKAIIQTGAKCSSASSFTTSGGSTRQVVILFNVETTSATPQPQCVEG